MERDVHSAHFVRSVINATPHKLYAVCLDSHFRMRESVLQTLIILLDSFLEKNFENHLTDREI